MAKTRIAPTPSGFLHAGNAFNFLVTDRLAKATGSRLVLRIDDLDAGRTRPEYIEDVFRSLQWLGIRVDEGPSGPDDFHANWTQHLRMPRYLGATEALLSRGALYPCSCSRPQLETLSRADHPCRTQPIGAVPRGTPWRLRIPEPCLVPVMELDGTITAPRLAHALTEAVIHTNRELRAWRIEQEAADHATLADVPDDEPGRLPYLYKRAVYSKAKADLMERMLNFDATATGQKKAESQEPAIDDHRRNARWAIRDILGQPRSTVELI